MKLFDLRLRGSMFTLGTVVDENDHMMFRNLICELQHDAPNDAELPETFTLSSEEVIRLDEWLISQGYCTKEGDVYSFTEKALNVFQKTIEVDNELSEKGFHHCPCSYC